MKWESKRSDYSISYSYVVLYILYFFLFPDVDSSFVVRVLVRQLLSTWHDDPLAVFVFKCFLSCLILKSVKDYLENATIHSIFKAMDSCKL